MPRCEVQWTAKKSFLLPAPKMRYKCCEYFWLLLSKCRCNDNAVILVQWARQRVPEGGATLPRPQYHTLAQKRQCCPRILFCLSFDFNIQTKSTFFKAEMIKFIRFTHLDCLTLLFICLCLLQSLIGTFLSFSFAWLWSSTILVLKFVMFQWIK